MKSLIGSILAVALALALTTGVYAGDPTVKVKAKSACPVCEGVDPVPVIPQATAGVKQVVVKEVVQYVPVQVQQVQVKQVQYVQPAQVQVKQVQVKQVQVQEVQYVQVQNVKVQNVQAHTHTANVQAKSSGSNVSVQSAGNAKIKVEVNDDNGRKGLFGRLRDR